MPEQLKVAICQINSNADEVSNISRAKGMVEEAAAQGAKLVALPELFHCLGDFDLILKNRHAIPGPLTDELASWARRLEITFCAGTICESSDDEHKGYNTSLIFSPAGELVSTYRKMHLFQVDLPDRISLCEADHMLPGQELGLVEIEGLSIGQSICYDLRFPELSRQLATRGADLIVMPSAFTRPTGKEHWHILVRARAIENQLFVVAPNQVGRHNQTLESYGHSMIVDPWGRVLAEASETSEGIISATLDFSEMTKVRHRLPSLANRKM